MVSSSECRLLVDPPADGPWNMAVDEVLLGWAGERRQCVVRLYQWDCPTLSLGYFQAFSDRCRHPPSLTCALVRRATGGGAILHDAELTYSIALPGGHPLGRERLSLYRTVHEALIEVLADFELPGALCSGEETPGSERPFLCFQRRAVGDVLCATAKIAGSAQRRLAGGVLQHGSVLLRSSPAAPELPGIEDLCGRTIGPDELGRRWLGRLAARLGWRWRRDLLSGAERRAAEALVAGKYGDAAWNRRR